MLTRKLDESFLKCLFLFGPAVWIPQLAQALFGHMADKIADIQSWITQAIKVKIYEVYPLLIDHDLGRVEITMDSADAWLRHGCAKAVARGQHVFEPLFPRWFHFSDFGEALVEDP